MTGLVRSLCGAIGRMCAVLLALGLAAPQAVAAELGDIDVLTRREWGGHKPKTKGVTKRQYKKAQKPNYISIHFTQSRPFSKRWKERELLRFVQEGHQNKRGFGDIAYHYIVGHSGAVYKGRSLAVAPASGTHYYSLMHLRHAKHGVKGHLQTGSVPERSRKQDTPGHTEDHITVTFLLGLGEPPLFSDEVMARAAKAIARLLIAHDLTPEAVRAHREVAITECPGDHVYRWLRGDKMQPDSDGVGMGLIRAEFARLTN